MKNIVWKPRIIKINKLHLRKSGNLCTTIRICKSLFECIFLIHRQRLRWAIMSFYKGSLAGLNSEFFFSEIKYKVVLQIRMTLSEYTSRNRYLLSTNYVCNTQQQVYGEFQFDFCFEYAKLFIPNFFRCDSNFLWHHILMCIILRLGLLRLKIDLVSYPARAEGLVNMILRLGLMGWVLPNGPGDLGSIPGRVIPKTLKMVLDTSLLNTQQYKIRTKGKVEPSWERSSALPYSSV